MATLGAIEPWLGPWALGVRAWALGVRAWAVTGVLLDAGKVAVGTTPKEEIWRQRGACCARYLRQTPANRRTPVLLIGPLFIRRGYLFDLRPGTSFVEFLLQQGFDVFTLDWERTTVGDCDLDLNAFVTGYLRPAIQKASLAAGGTPLTLLGLSIGGTLAVCLAAGFPEDPVKNLVLLNTPVDFSDPGYPGVWLASDLFPLDQLTATMPAIPTRLPFPNLPLFDDNCLATAFNPAPRTFVGTTLAYLRLWRRLGNPGFDVQLWQAAYRWLNDGVAFPAAAFRQWVEELYRANRLARGTLRLGGRHVRLADLHCPLLSVAADADTVAPRTSTSAILRLAGSPDKTEVVLPGGHVGVVVGCAASTQLWPTVAAWLARHD